MAYELLAGRLLFDAEDETALMSQQLSHDGWPDALAQLADVPGMRGIAAVLGACLRRDFRNRPGADEVRSALHKARQTIDVDQLGWPVDKLLEAADMTA